MPVSGLGPYDDANIFARLLRGEIPSRRVYEDEWAVAFHDIAPQAPVHVLVIPRGRMCRWRISPLTRPTRRSPASSARSALVARQLGLEEPGYRALANIGQHGGQEVPHFHVHLFGGQALSGRMAMPRGA